MGCVMKFEDIKKRFEASPSMGYGITHYREDGRVLLDEVNRLRADSLTLSHQRNRYENALKAIAERDCEELPPKVRCIDSSVPFASYCCPCTAKATLKPQD